MHRSMCTSVSVLQQGLMVSRHRGLFSCHISPLITLTSPAVYTHLCCTPKSRFYNPSLFFCIFTWVTVYILYWELMVFIMLILSFGYQVVFVRLRYIIFILLSENKDREICSDGNSSKQRQRNMLRWEQQHLEFGYFEAQFRCPQTALH